MRILALLIAGIILVTLLSAAPGMAQSPPDTPPEKPKAIVEKPTTKVDPKSCVTSTCHTGVKQHKVVHGPVNVNACDACHTLTDEKKHTYKLTRKPEELCGFCHVVDTEGAKVVHQPLADGQCLACHDPHGGFDRNSLRAESMDKLCNSCHQSVVGNHKQVHGPVAAGACGACHQPHVSQNEHLLVTPGKDLCLSCHVEMGKQLQNTRYVHQPVKDECMQCHDPHASDHKMIIRQAPRELCTSCHEDVNKAITQAKFQHAAVTEDDACSNCHTAHGSDMANLMKKRPVELCMQCHDQPVTTNDGRNIKAVNEITDPKLVKHGPVAEGSCGGCHNVHGADISRLLTKEYPETFYESFAVEKYDLCFTCHDKQLVLTRQAKGLTDFRDGDLNLHFMHVNKVERGRTCRACHSTHASTHAVHIRESVPYGNWQLPINFTATETGGSCAPGCHQELSYDRNKESTDEPKP